MSTRCAVVLAAAMCLFGCGDDDGPGGSGGSGGTGGSGGSGGTGGGGAPCDDAATSDCVCVSAPTHAPTFDAVFDEVLCTNTCTGSFCHGASGEGGLTLHRREEAYADLVGVLADGSECATSGLTRVVPGDATASLLVQKLRPSPACGGAMPQLVELSNIGWVPPDQIAQIEAWISAGALRTPPAGMDAGSDDAGN